MLREASHGGSIGLVLSERDVHCTPSLSCLLCILYEIYISILNFQTFSFTSLLSFFMHPCMYELSMFVVAVYKHVFYVRHIINGVEPHKALFKV